VQQRKTPVQQTAALRCACGHGIYCELERKGERLGLLTFFDDEPLSSTLGERVECCPGCGKRLAIHNVLTKKSPKGA
jgi:hypothetical protein